MSKDREAELLARIVVDPEKMAGRPLIRGRRITPSMVLSFLANGGSRDDVLAAYPALERDDIDACLRYAAKLAERADGGASFAAE